MIQEFLVIFFEKTFSNTDSRYRNNKKLNPGFLFATLLWPRIFEESDIDTKLNFRKILSKRKLSYQKAADDKCNSKKIYKFYKRCLDVPNTI